MIVWLNHNQGFVITILTFIYVVTTILILFANRKSTNAANTANKQQLSLQLLDRRLSAYYQLNDWISIAKSLTVENFPLGTPRDLFISMLYSNRENNDMAMLNKQISELQVELNNSYPISTSSRARKEEVLAQLIQERFFKRFLEISSEKSKIGQIEVLFPQVDFKPIESFSNSFFHAFVDTNEANTLTLISNYKTISSGENAIVNRIWKEIKDI